MKRIFILLCIIPMGLMAQIPDPLVDLSKYHDGNRLLEMTDLNFTNITDGSYRIPYLLTDTVQTKYIKLEPTLEKILFFDLSKMKKGVGSPPDDGVEQGFETLDFGATNDEETYAVFYGPLDWAAGSVAEVHMGFFVDAAPVTADTVVWGAEFVSIDPDGVFSFTSTDTALDSVRITAGVNKKVHDAILIIPAVDLEEESILMMRTYRDANNGSDTNTSEARLFDFHIHYWRDKI